MDTIELWEQEIANERYHYFENLDISINLLAESISLDTECSKFIDIQEGVIDTIKDKLLLVLDKIKQFFIALIDKVHKIIEKIKNRNKEIENKLKEEKENSKEDDQENKSDESSKEDDQENKSEGSSKEENKSDESSIEDKIAELVKENSPIYKIDGYLRMVNIKTDFEEVLDLFKHQTDRYAEVFYKRYDDIIKEYDKSEEEFLKEVSDGTYDELLLKGEKSQILSESKRNQEKLNKIEELYKDITKGIDKSKTILSNTNFKEIDNDGFFGIANSSGQFCKRVTNLLV